MSNDNKIDIGGLGYTIFAALSMYESVDTLKRNGWSVGDIVGLVPPISGCTKAVLIGQDKKSFHVRRIKKNGKAHQYTDMVPYSGVKHL